MTLLEIKTSDLLPLPPQGLTLWTPLCASDFQKCLPPSSVLCSHSICFFPVSFSTRLSSAPDSPRVTKVEPLPCPSFPAVPVSSQTLAASLLSSSLDPQAFPACVEAEVSSPAASQRSSSTPAAKISWGNVNNRYCCNMSFLHQRSPPPKVLGQTKV